MAPTNAQLTEENDRLRARVAELESAQGARPTVPLTPSFGVSEGEREEIERTGKAVSPFDGKVNTEADLPERVTVDPAARQGEPAGPTTNYTPDA
jgi:hypothetical protein